MKFIINFFKNLFGTKKTNQEKYEKNENTVKTESLEIPVIEKSEPIEEKKEIIFEAPKQEIKEETTIKLKDAIVPKKEKVKEDKPSEPAVKDEPKKTKKEVKSEKPKQVKEGKKTEKVEKSEPAKKSKPKK